MKRKTILCGGVFLIILYSLAFIASVALTAASVIYFFVNDTIQIVNDLLLPIIKPFLGYGEIVMLVAMGVLVLVTMLMLIGSSRFIKHSYSSAEVYGKKKKMLIFYFILAFLLFAGLCALLVLTLMSGADFMENILANGVLIFAIFVHLVSLILIFAGLKKYKASVTYVAPTEANAQEQQPQAAEEIVAPTKPAIYTSGLDPDEERKPVAKPVATPAATQAKEPVQAKGIESDNTKKLIEAIGILDQKRKDGSISMEEYTRLRAQMIKKFVK